MRMVGKLANSSGEVSIYWRDAEKTLGAPSDSVVDEIVHDAAAEKSKAYNSTASSNAGFASGSSPGNPTDITSQLLSGDIRTHQIRRNSILSNTKVLEDYTDRNKYSPNVDASSTVSSTNANAAAAGPINSDIDSSGCVPGRPRRHTAIGTYQNMSGLALALVNDLNLHKDGSSAQQQQQQRQQQQQQQQQQNAAGGDVFRERGSIGSSQSYDCGGSNSNAMNMRSANANASGYAVPFASGMHIGNTPPGELIYNNFSNLSTPPNAQIYGSPPIHPFSCPAKPSGRLSLPPGNKGYLTGYWGGREYVNEGLYDNNNFSGMGINPFNTWSKPRESYLAPFDELDKLNDSPFLQPINAASSETEDNIFACDRHTADKDVLEYKGDNNFDLEEFREFKKKLSFDDT